MPIRIQRSRSAGWLMPEGAVYVGRPTKWGNPFTIADIKARTIDTPDVVAAMWVTRWFRDWVTGKNCPDELEERRREILAHIDDLRGRDLCCWCAPHRHCHADVLLELANGGPHVQQV